MRTSQRPADPLLAELEPLPHSERCRRLAGLRRLAGDRALVALLVDLGQRGPYERGLALSIAAAVRDEASLEYIAIVARIGRPGLARAAVRLAVRFGTGADELLDLLADAPASVRRAAWSAVREHRRRDGLADALVDPVAKRWGDAEAASLLPACRPDTVADRLGTLAHAVPSWKALGRAHPGLVLDHAERVSGGTPADGARDEPPRRLASGIAVAAHHSPGRVVTLLERVPGLLPAPDPGRHRHAPPAPRRDPLPLLGKVGVLLDAEPRRMLEFLLGPHRPALWVLTVTRHARSVCARLARYGDDDLAAIALAVQEHAGNALQPALRNLLRAVPPSRRERLFSVLRADARARGGATLLMPLLDLLPRPVRARHARSLAGSPAAMRRDLPLYAHLPYEEARPFLEGMSRDADGYRRANGTALLIACAARSGDAATLLHAMDALDRVEASNPSLGTVVYALVAVPAAALGPEQAARIGRFAHRVMDERDGGGSLIDRAAAALLRAGLVREDPAVLATAAALLDRRTAAAPHLVNRTGALGRHLPRGRERLLSDAIASYLDADARRGDHRFTLMFAGALRRRAEDVPSLRDALARAVDTAEGRTRDKAIARWLDPPRTRAERVEHVVARHPAAVAVPSVLRVIATERTDLLDLVLTADLDVARIDPAWTRRWTARQRAFLALLDGRSKSG
ncbi:hypothetical protein [Actinomadura algeriensis]|uniref:HEAT repeat protein n=1 Tax=Actinomadura algeriensis TaxID=1679523 RepID=A0ABR9K3S9_9ACTN|nr:hypothetical protein [Actinomadura algeriensis]MBE1537503.1 hypothetical protein [Actinomadura algeriensis]